MLIAQALKLQEVFLQRSDVVRHFAQVLRRQVRIALNHTVIRPTAHLPNGCGVSTLLDVPRCPRMPQVMPSEVIDPSSLQSIPKRFRIATLHWPTAICKYPLIILVLRPESFPENVVCGVIQRDGEWLPVLHLLADNRHYPVLKIDLLPTELADVSVPKSSGEGEDNLILQM